MTIRDEVYRRLLSVKRKDESFSELFERLVEEADPADILKKIRGSIELTGNEKGTILRDIKARLGESRILT